jgi:calcium-translocating P-type ATPase, SERCA-type
MTIHYIRTLNDEFEVTGDGYVNNGQVELNGKQLWYDEHPDLKVITEIASLDNDTSIENKDGQNKILGTPTEASLVIMAQKAGYDIHKQMVKMPRLREFPFDSERKKMSTVNQISDTEAAVLVKGSYSDLIKDCAFVQVNGEVKPLTMEVSKNWIA